MLTYYSAWRRDDNIGSGDGDGHRNELLQSDRKVTVKRFQSDSRATQRDCSVVEKRSWVDGGDAM